MREMRNKDNRKLESLLELVSGIDEIFNEFNNKDLRETSNYKIACTLYILGRAEKSFESDYKENFKDNPDYQKAVTRLKIIRDKLYREAKRRDEEREER